MKNQTDLHCAFKSHDEESFKSLPISVNEKTSATLQGITFNLQKAYFSMVGVLQSYLKQLHTNLKKKRLYSWVT